MKEFIKLQNYIIRTNSISYVTTSELPDRYKRYNIHISQGIPAELVISYFDDEEEQYRRDLEYLKGILLGEEKKEIPLDTRLDTLHIQRGLLITLNTYDINTVGDLLSHTKEDLLRLKSLGRTKWWYLKDFLGRYNLELKK